MSYNEMYKKLKTKCPVCGQENEVTFMCRENTADGVLLCIEYKCVYDLDGNGCGAEYYFKASEKAVKEHLLLKEEAEA